MPPSGFLISCARLRTSSRLALRRIEQALLRDRCAPALVELAELEQQHAGDRRRAPPRWSTAASGSRPGRSSVRSLALLVEGADPGLGAPDCSIAAPLTNSARTAARRPGARRLRTAARRPGSGIRCGRPRRERPPRWPADRARRSRAAPAAGGCRPGAQAWLKCRSRLFPDPASSRRSEATLPSERAMSSFSRLHAIEILLVVALVAEPIGLAVVVERLQLGESGSSLLSSSSRMRRRSLSRARCATRRPSGIRWGSGAP